jgi:pyruvate kinase
MEEGAGVTRRRRTRIVVTLGPATTGVGALAALRARGVDFVRTNMSHSSLGELERAVAAAARAGLPFIIDTEGSQVRSGDMVEQVVRFEEGDELRLWSGPEPGHRGGLQLKPPAILPQLEEGDLLHVDFDTLVLRVTDVSTAPEGFVAARAISGGWVGRNKAVVVDPIAPRPLRLPVLSEKDLESIRIGLREGVGHVAVSFVRSGAAVDEVRAVTQGKMQIISKIECVDALDDLAAIIDRSDWLLIDRGDLSKEIALERIPFVQKFVIHEAAARGKGVFVATNLLETMIEKRNPTRAEVQDVVNTVLDGAAGLTLAAETAIGRYPNECVTMLGRLVDQAERVTPGAPVTASASGGHFAVADPWPSLSPPHGGRLVSRVVSRPPEGYLALLPVLALDGREQVLVELIANGTLSPLEGFMGPDDLESVVRDMTLADGTVWPVPVVLSVTPREALYLPTRGTIALADETGAIIACMQLERAFTSPSMPGEVLLEGRLSYFGRRRGASRQHELSPRQTRTLFQARSWRRILGDWWDGADARSGLRQKRAVEQSCCDAIFVQALIEPGAGAALLSQCEQQLRALHGRDTLLFAAQPVGWGTGPREALLGAICRLNHGCSHMVVPAGLDPVVRARLESLPVELVELVEPAEVETIPAEAVSDQLSAVSRSSNVAAPRSGEQPR